MRFTADQMFDLVNDVDAYPQFLNWCRSSSIERVGDSEVVATMKVGLGGLHRSITTRNTFKRPEGISMEMVAGPFRDLTGNWRFEPAHGTGCIVALELEIQLSTTPFDMMFAALFEDNGQFTGVRLCSSCENGLRQASRRSIRKAMSDAG